MVAPRPPRSFLWLDAMRAAAALCVLLSHVRAFTVRDAVAQPSLSLTGRLIFAVTGLGHQAVIVFFVLSGFLVTRSMCRLAAEGRWSLGRFAIDRLIRLWLVLVPCLVLGGLLDAVGLQIAAHAGDTIHYGHLAITDRGIPPTLDATTLLGNLLFMQAIAVPVFGSNGPLWSLAAEGWFYALAALAFVAWRQRRQRGWAAFPLLALLAIVTWLPASILQLFPIWLFGAACAVAYDRSGPARPVCLRSLGTALTAVAAMLVVSRMQAGLQSLADDWGLGLATAWLVTALISLPTPGPAWFRPVKGLSALSYSLYLSHVPLLALFAQLVIGPRRLALSSSSLVLMACETALALAYAAALWWLFERHTASVRRLLRAGPLRRRLAGPTLAGTGVGP